ncbi:type II secretion system protein GspL [Chromatiaceae bacterium AAb-1]|nr:type II secretion system protein GspL [Chromatiaceae bacterium AAb-1]
MHVLLLEMSAQGSWQVTDFQHIVHRPGQWQTALHQALALLPANTRLSVVLSSSQYQLLQADKPMVPGSEIIQALPWQIKELISTDISDIVVDYIDLPVKPQQTERINIVVASKSWLKELIEIIHQYKVRLHIIQPEEWLPMTLLPSETQPSMLVMHQPEQELLIQIIYKGTLYFSRRYFVFFAPGTWL